MSATGGTGSAPRRLHRPARSRGPVVVVDGVLNGQPFKVACARVGLPLVGVYTIEVATLAQMSPTHADGDMATLYGRDTANLARRVSEVTDRVSAVVPATEPGVHCAALLAEHFDVPGNRPGSAFACRDKRAMRRLAAARGIRVPRFETAADIGAIASAAARISPPVIVKPATGAASHNVFLLENPGDLPLIAGADPHDLFGGLIDEWLVEEYIEGQEFAVNTFTCDGQHVVLDVWEYRLPNADSYDNPYWDFVQADPADPAVPLVTALAMRALDAFEISLGPCHIEVKVDGRGPALIEIGARLPGAGIPLMWQRHSNLRPYDDTLAGHLGGRPDVMDHPPRFDGRLGMCFIRNDGPPGRVRRLEGVERVRQIPGVADVTVLAGVDDTVPTTRSLGTELVKVRLCAPPDADFARFLAEVRAMIDVEIEPLAPVATAR